jgi:maltose alpha-D-glucosyltransferase/alpha-amylase
MDPVYGYDAINVEAQERSPFSLLHWMKRMIALRRQHPVFGRGTIEFVRTDNRKVLTYVRHYDGDTVLCVANLSRAVQPVEIPLAGYAGFTPVEMLGHTQLPKIGDQPYFLTLAPYGFYWFHLQEAVVSTTGRTAAAVVEEHPAVPALFAGVVWDAVLDGSMRTIVERQALVPFLKRQRWFGGKARPVSAARFIDWTTLRRGAHPAFVTIVQVEYRDGGREHYALPLSMISGPDAVALEQQHGNAVVSRITGARKGVLYDGLFDDGTCSTLLEAMQQEWVVPMKRGVLRGVSADSTEIDPESRMPIHRSAPDQSNTSVLFGWHLIMKMFRRLEAGPNPDVEIGTFLAARDFTRVPPLAGTLSYASTGDGPAAVMMLQRYVPNQGNAWDVTIEELGRYFERVAALPPRDGHRDESREWIASSSPAPPPDVVESIGQHLRTSEVLGRRTGELHMALAGAPEDPAFGEEKYSAADLEATVAAMRAHASAQLQLLHAALRGLDGRKRQLAEGVLSRRDDLLRQFDALLALRGDVGRLRCHGDYHLGQVLITEGDVVLIDFEGEPARPLAERRAKSSPLRDVAGMLRSFAYAALTGLAAATQTRPEDVERLAPWADLWETWVGATFLRAYRDATRTASFHPAGAEDFDMLLHAFVLDKAMYELGYELNNRPDWVHIPLIGVMRLAASPPSPSLRSSAMP